MRNQLLFVVAPYAALAAFLPSCLLSHAIARRWPRSEPGPSSGMLSAASSLWRWAIGLVLTLHVVLITSPASVLAWDRQPQRLFAFEMVGLALGIGAALSFGVMIAARLRSRGPVSDSPLGVAAGALFVLAVATGLGIAIGYRWASYWSVVTLSPYLQSLVRFEPSTALVVRLPFLVRLHVVTAYAILAVAPFTPAVRSALARLHAWLARASGPIAAAIGAAEAWGTRAAQAMLASSDGEEN